MRLLGGLGQKWHAFVACGRLGCGVVELGHAAKRNTWYAGAVSTYASKLAARSSVFGEGAVYCQGWGGSVGPNKRIICMRTVPYSGWFNGDCTGMAIGGGCGHPCQRMKRFRPGSSCVFSACQNGVWGLECGMRGVGGAGRWA
eukprot:171615-Chlamydomonas_euryale.AAC.1